MILIIRTSALDTYTEQALQNINSILKEKSRPSVFLAHRLHTISDSDQILDLKEGHVAETGSRRELLERDGIHAELWNTQEQSMDQDVELEGSQDEDVQPRA
ncbi:hypothetical protein N7536_003320 [Penicillium majusculum]|nr:hypothetical protein N7536_003320 [Penicillium majusculum]